MTQLSRESVCRSVVSCPKNNGKTKKKKKGASVKTVLLQSVRVRVVCIVKSRRRFVLFGGNLVLENAQR